MARPTSAELSGMTANERFYALGLLDRFDAAKARRDRDEMIALYRAAEIDDAETYVDSILVTSEDVPRR